MFQRASRYSSLSRSLLVSMSITDIGNAYPPSHQTLLFLVFFPAKTPSFQHYSCLALPQILMLKVPLPWSSMRHRKLATLVTLSPVRYILGRGVQIGIWSSMEVLVRTLSVVNGQEKVWRSTCPTNLEKRLGR